MLFPSFLNGPLAGALLVVASLAPLFAAQDVADAHSGTVAAVFPPAFTAEDSFGAAVRAGGRIVQDGGWANVILVRDDAPGLAGRLRREGAWLVLAPEGLGGCLIRPSAFADVSESTSPSPNPQELS